MVGEHSWAVVTPNGEVAYLVGGDSTFLGQLPEGSVVIESAQGSEVLSGDILSVVRKNQAVGIAGISDNKNLGGSLSVVIDGLSSGNEDLAVLVQEVSSLLSWSSGL